MGMAKLLVAIVAVATVLVSGCVSSETSVTTTTFNSVTTIPVQTVVSTTTTTTTTSTTITQPSKLTNWAKENGARVVNGISSSTIIKNNEYWMYYTGRGIELATSEDGLNFELKGSMVIPDIPGSGQEMVTNPSVFKLSYGRYRMIYEGARMTNDEKGGRYQTDRKLYSAISSDGMIWTKEPGTRFWDYGDGKPGEIFTSVPDVIRLADGRLRMYYTKGATSATALSGDEGLTWVKETNLDLRKVAVDPDILQLEDGSYKLFFTTFESEFGIGEQWVVGASSADGINFVLDNGKLVEPGTSGGLITDPDVVKTGDGYRMYYGEFRKGERDSNIMSAFGI